MDFSTTASVSCALRAAHGVYRTDTLSHTRNPVFATRHPAALVLRAQAMFSF